jgi:mono/diheme cytochrome c family protein
MRFLLLVLALTGFSAKIALADGKGKSPSPAELEKMKKEGATLFKANCASCHGEDGTGNPAMAAIKPRNFKKDAFKNGDKPEQIFKTITEGVAGTAMVGFKQLKEDQRWALSYFVKSLK